MTTLRDLIKDFVLDLTPTINEDHLNNQLEVFMEEIKERIVG